MCCIKENNHWFALSPKNPTVKKYAAFSWNGGIPKTMGFNTEIIYYLNDLGCHHFRKPPFLGLCRAIMEIPRTHLRAGPDIGFALTVGVSQAFSIIVAGITGSIEPWPLRGDQWIDIWIYSAYSYDTHISEHMISSSHRYFIYFICKGMCCMYKYSHTHTYRYTYIYYV